MFIDTLSAPEFKRLDMSFKFLIPPPTVRGTKQFFDVFSTISKIISLFSLDAVISKKKFHQLHSHYKIWLVRSQSSVRFTK